MLLVQASAECPSPTDAFEQIRARGQLKRLAALALFILLLLFASSAITYSLPASPYPTTHVEGSVSINGTETGEFGTGALDTLQLTFEAQGPLSFEFRNMSSLCATVSLNGCPDKVGGIVGSANISGTFSGTDTVYSGTGFGDFTPSGCVSENGTTFTSVNSNVGGFENASGFYIMLTVFPAGLNLVLPVCGEAPLSERSPQAVASFVVLYAPIELTAGFSSDAGSFVKNSDFCTSWMTASCQESWSVKIDFASVVGPSSTTSTSSSSTTPSTTSSTPVSTSTTAVMSSTEATSSAGTSSSLPSCPPSGSSEEAICPSVPIGGVQSLQGSAEVANGLTGTLEDAGAVNLGDVVTVGGGGSVAGMKCIGGGQCDTQLEANTIAVFEGIWYNPLSGVQVGPDESSSPTVGQWFDSIKSSSNVFSFFSDVVREGYLSEQGFSVTEYAGGKLASETVQGAIIEGISQGSLHVAETEANGINDAIFGDPTAVVVPTGTEFTFSSEPNGTTTQVFSGSVLVMSLATGQTATVDAGQELFIPADSSQAGAQNLAESVQSFDPSSVAHWWVSASSPTLPGVLGIPLLWGAVIVLAVIAVSVSFVSSRRVSPRTAAKSNLPYVRPGRSGSLGRGILLGVVLLPILTILYTLSGPALGTTVGPPSAFLLFLLAAGFAAGVVARGAKRGAVGGYAAGVLGILLVTFAGFPITFTSSVTTYSSLDGLLGFAGATAILCAFGGVVGGAVRRRSPKLITAPPRVLAPSSPQSFRHLDARFCPNCGNEFKPGEKFCRYCGSSLG